MTLKTPLWMQSTTELDPIEYTGVEDRSILDLVFGEGVATAGGLAVSQRAAGANLSVDVAAGTCIVQGDDQTDQGKYLCESDAVTNVVMTAAPGSNKRRDIIVARVRDAQAGGGDGPTDHDWVIEAVEGTDIHATDPAAPATPDSAILLATVLRTAGDATVTNAMITDARTIGLFQGKEMSGLILTDYSEKIVEANSGSAYVLDFNTAAVHIVTLTANCTFSMANPPPDGQAQTITLVLKAGGTDYTRTYPASWKWAGGTTPASSGINKADMISLTTWDGGVTYAAMIVQNFSGLG